MGKTHTLYTHEDNWGQVEKIGNRWHVKEATWTRGTTQNKTGNHETKDKTSVVGQRQRNGKRVSVSAGFCIKLPNVSCLMQNNATEI